MDSQSAVRRPLELSLLLLLGLLTAIPYALTKIALVTIPPVTMVAARVSLAAIMLVIVAFVMRCKWPRRADLIPCLFVQGCIACALPYTLLAYGQLSVDSALTAILNSTTPLFVCVIGALLTQHEPISFGRMLGVGIGLAAIVVIAGANALSGIGQSFGQAAVVVASAVSAVSIIYGRRFADVPPVITAAGSLISAALVLVPLSFVVEAPLQSAPSAASLAALVINAVAATAIGAIVYFRLIQTIGSLATASAGYLKPAIGVLIGAIFLGETLTLAALTALIAILLGVSLINRNHPSGAPARLGSRLVTQSRAAG